MTRKDFLRFGRLAMAPAVIGLPVRGQSGGRPKNVLLLMSDQHRRDCLGIEGKGPARSPNLDNLARSGMTRRGNTNLKSLLADHLGISETRVSKYLSEHCVVRWLQLDEGSTNFQHFAIAVLRPILDQ